MCQADYLCTKMEHGVLPALGSIKKDRTIQITPLWGQHSACRVPRNATSRLVNKMGVDATSWVVNKIAQSRKGAKLTLYIGKVNKVSDTVDLHYVSEPLNTSMVFYSFPEPA